MPGSVTPFGVLNDDETKVKVFFDQDFLDAPGLIGIHPNDNTATAWLKTEDLVDIVKGLENELNFVKI